jgi:hypothetical protein
MGIYQRAKCWEAHGDAIDFSLGLGWTCLDYGHFSRILMAREQGMGGEFFGAWFGSVPLGKWAFSTWFWALNHCVAANGRLWRDRSTEDLSRYRWGVGLINLNWP